MEWYYVWWPWLTSKRVPHVCQHKLSFLFALAIVSWSSSVWSDLQRHPWENFRDNWNEIFAGRMSLLISNKRVKAHRSGVNGGTSSQWERSNFDLRQNPNPWVDCQKLGTADKIRGATPHAKFGDSQTHSRRTGHGWKIKFCNFLPART